MCLEKYINLLIKENRLLGSFLFHNPKTLQNRCRFENAHPTLKKSTASGEIFFKEKQRIV